MKHKSLAFTIKYTLQLNVLIYFDIHGIYRIRELSEKFIFTETTAKPLFTLERQYEHYYSVFIAHIYS